MKKWILGFFGVLLAGVLFVDLVIPSTLEVARVAAVPCKPMAAFPFLSNEARWKTWWPDSSERKDFHIDRLSYQTIDIGIRWGQQALKSRMVLLPSGSQDSTLLHWETRLQCGWNPVDRLRQYERARRLSDVMDQVLYQAGDFLGKQENVYGVKIGEGSTTDTMLIATRVEKARMPTNADIYALISKLTRYISFAHSQQKGYPMANITRLEDRLGMYRLMVAIPVSTLVESKGDIFFMRMPPAKFLIADVTGGGAAVDSAMAGLRDYIRDHQRTVMAIPFQSLVTDRMREPDSTKWVTKIYYPVM